MDEDKFKQTDASAPQEPVVDVPLADRPPQEPATSQPAQPIQPIQPMQPVERLDVPAVADTTVMDGNSRPKIGIIAAIIGGVFLLLFIGVLIWFFAFYNSAKTIAADAITNVITSPNLHIKGSQEITPTIETGIQTAEHNAVKLESVSIKADSASRYYDNALASSTDVTVSVNTSDGKSKKSTDLNLGLILDQNKKIYANVNGVSDALNQISSTNYGQQIAPFKDFITMLEKDWWQIDARDTALSLNLSKDRQEALEASYDCILQNLNDKNFTTVSNIYSKHQFLSAIQDNERQAYRMDIDPGQLADFMNEFIHSETINKVITCVNNASKGLINVSVISNKDITADQVAQVVEKLPVVYAKIDLFGHRMSQVFFDQTDSDLHVENTANYEIEYPASVEIKSPDSYRPASEAIQAFLQTFKQQSATTSDTNSELTTVETE